MKEKRVLSILFIFLISIILVLSLVVAQEQGSDEKGYNCLIEKLGTNCGGTRNTEQAAFNLLAMAYDSSIQSDCKSSLKNKRSGNCWGDTEADICKLKPTSLAILALNHVDDNAGTDVDWLLEKSKPESELKWYLEIDSNNKTECNINGRKVTIESNKKISGSNPQGLEKAFNGYWFEIRDTARNYTISCDRDFITALLYQKPGSEVYYISSQTNSAPAHDTISEKVNSKCFSTTAKCDYEGSLWATLALAKTGNDISPYLPYITAMFDDMGNKKYLPSAFLYMLTNADEYYVELLNHQKQNKYWDEGTNKFFDTSLALLALQGLGIEQIENTKNYLFDLQESTGCWSSYTSFILYAGWPKSPLVVDTGDSLRSDCESYGYSCVGAVECNLEDTLDNFYCVALSDVCCEKAVVEPSCDEKGGIICDSVNQECSGDEVSSLDTDYCCLGTCEDISLENECEGFGYTCRSTCLDNEGEKISYSSACEFGEFCCARETKEQGANWLMIILLIILIILVILAILFRNQLKVWWFKSKTKFKGGKGPKPTNRPPQAPIGTRMMPALRGPPRRRPLRRSASASRRTSRDKDFEETMKKLRDISR